MTGPLLEVRDLEVAFDAEGGRVEAVKGVSFVVPRHRTVALVGESGSGKTVISQAVLGILPPNGRITGGSILFHDAATGDRVVDLATLAPDSAERRHIRGRRISIIFQEPMSSLSPLHTIGDQIGETLIVHRSVSRSEARRETLAVLHKVGFPNPENYIDHYTFELSGGLRQRAMIAMALICRPVLLIADEPTTALDVTIQAQILKLLGDLQDEFGMSILFITHDLGVVANMADDVVVMFRGRIMEAGTARELIEHPQHPYLKALLHAVPRLHGDPNERLSSLREARVGSDLGLTRRAAPSPGGGKPLLEVKGLKKTYLTRRAGWISGEYRTVVAVDDISFSIDPGESFAVVGESGSGKTTVSKIIMRAVMPDSGQVLWHDENGTTDVLALSESDLLPFRRKIQYIFQDPYGSLNPRMTVKDILSEPLLIHGIGTEDERIERVKRLLEAVGLDTRHLRRYPHSFSGGQRQRIGIARALALNPRLLICDEPVSALDVSVQAQVLNLLKDLQQELGLTYLFISHNLAVVRYIAQRVGVMCAGRMVELGPVDSLFAAPRHPYTKALLAAVPEPDLDHPLDLSALMAGKASDPGAWPAPFNDNQAPARFVEVDQAHYVRMHQ